MELSYPFEYGEFCAILTSQLVFMTLVYCFTSPHTAFDWLHWQSGDFWPCCAPRVRAHAVCYNLITVHAFKFPTSVFAIEWVNNNEMVWCVLKSTHVNDSDESCPLTFPWRCCRCCDAWMWMRMWSGVKGVNEWQDIFSNHRVRLKIAHTFPHTHTRACSNMAICLRFSMSVMTNRNVNGNNRDRGLREGGEKYRNNNIKKKTE